jgi:hypothetical protein
MANTIKDVKKSSGGTGDRALAAFSVNPAVGDVIIVDYAMFGTKIPSAPTDTQGNTYTLVGTQSGGASTQIVRYMARVTTAGATTVTAHGTWTNVGVVAWLLTGAFSTSPSNGDFLTTFASSTSASVGPTTVVPYPGSIFLASASVANAGNLGDPTGYNTEGVNGFTAAMHTAAVLLDWSANEDLQTAYKLSSAVQSCTWPNSASGNQWATHISSFSPVRIPLPTSVAPTEVQSIGGEQLTITGTAGTFGSWVTGVTVGGVAATNVVVVNDTTITCTSPAHAAGAVNIVVTGSEGDSANLAGLTYSIRPFPTGLLQQFVFRPGGTSVTLKGTGFVTGASVTFGGVPATSVVVVDSQTITCVVPDGTEGAITITVTNP